MKSTLSKKWMWAGALPLIGSFAVCADTTGTGIASDASAEISPYIVNGTNASTSDFPSIASLFIDSLEYDNFYSSNPYCGATILDANHVMTAAHCIYGSDVAQLFTTVVPQLEDVRQYPSGSAQRHRISEIYYPNDYVDDINQLLPNDIAILKLEAPMSLSSSNVPVVLPQSKGIIQSEYESIFRNDFVAVGHGNTRSGFDSTDLLQRVDLSLISDTVCRQIFGSALRETNICFDGSFSSLTRLNGGTCQGDSGGPVYWNDGADYIQVGITSFGPSQCGDDVGATSVFTEVYYYYSWINSVLNGTETPKATSSDSQRTAYLNQHGNIQSVTSSSEDGGALSTLWLGVLLALGLRRTRSTRVLQGSRR